MFQKDFFMIGASGKKQALLSISSLNESASLKENVRMIYVHINVMY